MQETAERPAMLAEETGSRTERPKAVVCKELLDGIINLDTDRAKLLGFTSDKYDGYLWRQGDAIMVSFIVSWQRGNFRELVRRIHALGLTVKVPTPLGRMQEILLKNGYEHTTEPFDEEPGETVDVWVLSPSNTKLTHPAEGDRGQQNQ
jgi:hypothetical protein